MDNEINTIQNFFNFLETHSKTDLIFRGVKSVEYKLVPKIGRVKNPEGTILTLEQEKFILDLFKQKSQPYLKYEPKSELEWLALGQHYGLPTRLLDWTWNPLVATFFACEEDFDGDSALYVFRNSKELRIKTKDIEDFKPFSFGKDVMKFIPNHITERIKSQSGIFTIHNNRNEAFESDDIDIFVIKNRIRKKLKKHLFIYGISEETIYPGLDGLCKHIEWLRTDRH